MQPVNASTQPRVILVDKNDRELGTQDKLTAHQDGGQLHRAFSIFIIDDRGRVLLQRRAQGKYHCPGLWANSCCSHPQPGKSLLECSQTRLREELGFSTFLLKIGTVRYRLPLSNGFTEWEFDHIFLGRYNGPAVPNPDEVEACAWVRIDDLAQGMVDHAAHYVPWLPEIFPVFRSTMRNRNRLTALQACAGGRSATFRFNLHPGLDLCAGDGHL